MGSGVLILVSIVVVMYLWANMRNREMIMAAHKKGIPIYFRKDGEFRRVEKIYIKRKGGWEQ